MTLPATRVRVAVVIPTLDEAGSIAGVVTRVSRALQATVIVADNGSLDGTAEVAAAAGATVVRVARRGYGYACRAGSDAAAGIGADIAVFLDGDGSMRPEDIPDLLRPILEDRADLVCGVRPAHRALMPAHQRAGNRVIGGLLRLHGLRLPELCPMRAVRMDLLARLRLPGSRFAWPAQMLAAASHLGSRIDTVPVGYDARTAGRSKVGGSLRGSMAASWDIARVLVAERVAPGRRP